MGGAPVYPLRSVFPRLCDPWSRDLWDVRFPDFLEPSLAPLNDMKLIVAEKPSVARDLARVLGLRRAGANAIEGDNFVVTWCVGHLVELEDPESYDPAWKTWRMDTLPMLPGDFRLRPVARTKSQYQAVRRLLRDKRFQGVINACDAGREGELIFDYLYRLSGTRKKVERLWISSMTDAAIKQGFKNLRPGKAYAPLADAARCRSEADWLVGLNATRAVTLENRKKSPPPKGTSKPPLYSIGRVQTPTLAIVVNRDQEIANFKPQDYWEVHGRFSPRDHQGTPGAKSPNTGGAGASAFDAIFHFKKKSASPRSKRPRASSTVPTKSQRKPSQPS